MRHSDNARLKTIICNPILDLKTFVKKYSETLTPNFLKDS